MCGETQFCNDHIRCLVTSVDAQRTRHPRFHAHQSSCLQHRTSPFFHARPLSFLAQQVRLLPPTPAMRSDGPSPIQTPPSPAVAMSFGRRSSTSSNAEQLDARACRRVHSCLWTCAWVSPCPLPLVPASVAFKRPRRVAQYISTCVRATDQFSAVLHCGAPTRVHGKAVVHSYMLHCGVHGRHRGLPVRAGSPFLRTSYNRSDIHR
jgi:hypothetical protein